MTEMNKAILLAIKAFAFRILFSPRKQREIFRKAEYWTGFSGQGPTAFDAPTPQLRWWERLFVTEFMEELATFKQTCFREACLQVLGEDPDEWTYA